MTAKRAFSAVELSLLEQLWPLSMSDKEIAAKLGRHRGVVRRKAAEIGLPPRNFARRKRSRAVARAVEEFTA